MDGAFGLSLGVAAVERLPGDEAGREHHEDSGDESELWPENSPLNQGIEVLL
jgi:hypothetical protein